MSISFLWYASRVTGLAFFVRLLGAIIQLAFSDPLVMLVRLVQWLMEGLTMTMWMIIYQVSLFLVDFIHSLLWPESYV